MYGSILLLLLTGIVTGFMGNWWAYGWIWLSLILLIAIMAVMYMLGSGVYSGARKIAGLPYFEKGRAQPAVATGTSAELDAQLSKANPALLAAIGFGGIVVIGYLMMFHPF